MKKSLIVLSVLAVALLGCRKDDHRTFSEQTRDAADTAVAKTKQVASDVHASVSAKLTEWKLTPSDIKADLERGGRVVRTKAVVAGETAANVADNARIVTVINAKYVADSDLSALKIDVDAEKGVVTLKGTVATPDLIGRAILLALETDGVHEVVSLLSLM